MASYLFASFSRALSSTSYKAASVLHANSISVTSFPISLPSAPALLPCVVRLLSCPRSAQVTDDPYLDAFHQFFKLPSVEGDFKLFMNKQKADLVQNLKELSKAEPTVKTGLAIAASIDYLKLINCSTPELEKISKRARKGAMLLEKGQELDEAEAMKLHLENEGTGMVRTARNYIIRNL
ncbi:hypothetical protein F0562_007453 [Nyssa sinensis]|uniref:Uncharacterized protein n=1 Tax=Nyssa sinensis TaxID=561372 RepID=A0A5J5A6H1_9ASTE|nr:hypothetical protein F0562_007453 [Nyssa sinensis]